MLLRWALVYVLTVTTILLGGITVWQGQLMSADNERHKIALEKFAALEAATIVSQSSAEHDAREAAEVRSQLEREKRSCETTLTERAKDGQSLAEALQAITVAQTARDAAEARLAEELKVKVAGLAVLEDVRANAETLRLSTAAAVHDAATARAELARLQSQTRETSAIVPRTTPPAVQKAPASNPVPDVAAAKAATANSSSPPAISPAATTEKAGTSKLAPTPATTAAKLDAASSKAATDNTAKAEKAATTSTPATSPPTVSQKATTVKSATPEKTASTTPATTTPTPAVSPTKSEPDKTATAPAAAPKAAVPPAAAPSDSKPKTTAKSKPAAKVSSSKPRAKAKAKSGDATFDASFF